MASTYSDLKIELIGTGEQVGTWGSTTNTNLGTAIEEAITGSADVTFSSADVTLTLSNTNGTQTARNLRLVCTGTSGGARNLILGSGCQINKLYLIQNDLADTVTVKNTTGTGVAVAAGRSQFVFNDGTNVVAATSSTVNLTSDVTGTLPIANGGTNATATPTQGGITYGTGTAYAFTSAGTAGQALISDGTSAPIWQNVASTNTTGAIVERDGSGNFSAGTITATLSGNATTATTASACSGNSATATVLQTGRTINGTSFNGSANITTANWGTTRTLSIGGTGKSVNGSGNVTWSAAEITAGKLSTASGSAPSYSARAWVNFDGDPVSIRASGNVSSVTDDGVGLYTVNFSTAMPDTNYCTVMGTETTTTSNRALTRSPSGTATTTAFQVENSEYRSIPADGPWCNVVVFR